jgi:ATP-dependent helicase/nuclease subunit A
VSLSPSQAEGVHGDRGERLEHGRLAHGLLHFLPDLTPDRRAPAAKAYLDAEGGALSRPARAALAAQVLAVMETPELASFFGPGSRGEVSLAGVLRRPGRADLRYSGRLDRLAVTKAGISIVDFKLGPAPARPAAAHVAQLALYRAALRPLYPGLPALASLVYFDGPNIVPVGDAELDEALAATDAAQ